MELRAVSEAEASPRYCLDMPVPWEIANLDVEHEKCNIFSNRLVENPRAEHFAKYMEISDRMKCAEQNGSTSPEAEQTPPVLIDTQ